MRVAPQTQPSTALPSGEGAGLLGWPFDPTHAAEVAGWGFWLAVAGLTLTLLGFGVTIYQLKQTRRAADAAKDEAERIQRSLNRYEMVNEATRATAALATARNYLRTGMWGNVGDSYETVRDGLEALKTDAADLSDEHRKRIDEASKYIQNLCVRIERDSQNGVATIDSAKTLSVMARHRLLLSEITRIIERGVIQ